MGVELVGRGNTVITRRAVSVADADTLKTTVPGKRAQTTAVSESMVEMS